MTIPPILLVEGTTNLALNPSVETNALGLSTLTTGVTITRITTDAAHGSACAQIVCDGSTGNQGMYTQSEAGTAVQGDTFTVSVSVKGPVGESFRLIIRENFGSLSSRIETFTGDWQRVSITRTFTDATPSRCQLRIDGGTSAKAITFLADAFQLEKKPHATPFTTGTRAERRASGFLVPGTIRIGPMHHP